MNEQEQQKKQEEDRREQERREQEMSREYYQRIEREEWEKERERILERHELMRREEERQQQEQQEQEQEVPKAHEKAQADTLVLHKRSDGMYYDQDGYRYKVERDHELGRDVAHTDLKERGHLRPEDPSVDLKPKGSRPRAKEYAPVYDKDGDYAKVKTERNDDHEWDR